MDHNRAEIYDKAGGPKDWFTPVFFLWRSTEIELGNKKPTIETLSYICDALEISLKDFFDDDLFKQFPENELLNEIYKLTQRQTQVPSIASYCL